MEAVIYCRISGWPQAKGHGIIRQLESCDGYCEEHGLKVVAVFSDIGSDSSGGELQGRSSAERLSRLRGAVLLCETPCRWSRSQHDMPGNLVFTEPLIATLEKDLKGILERLNN